CGAGLTFGAKRKGEFFPEIRPNQVMVVAPYPGAAPEEIEKSLAIKIEDQLRDMKGVKEVNSTVSDGLASVRVEFIDQVSAEEAVAKVKREIDALQDLPELADRITVNAIAPSFPVCVLNIVGDADERDMKAAILQVRDDLRSLKGMGEVFVGGIRRDEITVEVRPEAMLAYGLSLPEISARIREAMIELPGGTVRSSTQHTSVRTMGADDRADAVRRIVIQAGDEGQVLRVGDIADVRDGFEDVDLTARLNGQPVVFATVMRDGTQDIVQMSEIVKAYAVGRRGEHLKLTARERLVSLLRRPGDDSPPSPRVAAYELGLSRPPAPGEVIITTDLARFVVGRLNLLMRNALWGGMLVFITLVLLLNWRVSFWVAIGLIVSLGGTLTMMYFVGITLNLLTMFGLIVVLGILVDDAIVVAENIVTRHERGEDPLTAAIRGAQQITWPVTATVLTTIAAFLPLALIKGTMGDFLGALPMVVGVALTVSLIESLFILPSHMGHSLLHHDRRVALNRQSRAQRFEDRFDAARDHFFDHLLIPTYTRFVGRCLRRRYTTLAVAIAILIGSVAMFAGGRLKFILFENSDAETVNATILMPAGTPTAVTDRFVARIERAFLDQPETKSAFAQAGAIGDLNGEGFDSSASHIGQVIVELYPVEQRERDSSAVIDAVREALGEMPGVKSLDIESVGAGPGGPGIELAVVGDRPEQIEHAVAALEDLLATKEAVFNISNDADAGQRELRLTLRDGANELGFTTESLARQVQGAVFGLEAHTFPGVQEDVDVRVILPKRIRNSLAAIERMFVFAPDGRAVPLSEVARIQDAQSYASFRRLDGKRAITVRADVRRSSGENPELVMRALKPLLKELAAGYPGIEIVERGRQKDFTESFSTLPLGMLVAAGLIYVILAWLFSSYLQPIIVMSAIPFAIIGVVWGHFVLGYTVTFLSMIGFIALSGIVVNDSLIYMQFFNEKRAKGWSVAGAAMLTGRARFRAILLTTVTTVLGLTPLMLEQSFQARFLIPMAITISFGLMSATGIILVVLPCLLVIGDDVQRVLRAVWTGRWGSD
ncbi:MAG: efflux RND transporter permease subunit, partial [Planctomycetes bacterium]|nr:efflux RND transporter permease subunit [Planctomycetota bacterium]